MIVHGTNVPPAFKQMRGETMAEGVAACCLWHLRRSEQRVRSVVRLRVFRWLLVELQCTKSRKRFVEFLERLRCVIRPLNIFFRVGLNLA